jgi:FkbM family methyltransferase
MESTQFIDECRTDGQKIERLIRHFYESLPDRGTFIDGGAHIGYHTVHAMKHFDTVVAIEASPKTYIQHFKYRTSEASASKKSNVVPLNAALGCRARQGDTVDFFCSETHPGRSTVNTALWDQWAKGAVEYNHAIRAAVVEIDDLRILFGGGQRIDFIKLDLEGNEINALRGGTATLNGDRPAIVMELGLKPHNEALYNETCGDFISMMSALGYGLYTPWATRAEDAIATGYPFWYVFALPDGDNTPLLVEHLRSVYDNQV